jgi:L-alanine-DL-glutamate epimerase-like enolase superfamily enzyme
MDETSRIAAITAERVDLPMERPFESAKRRSTVSEVVRITARLQGGAEGRGEASPAGYVTGEDAAGLQVAVVAATAALIDLPADRPQLWETRLSEALPHHPTGRSAVEAALLDALAARCGLSLWRWLGGATPTVVSDLTIPLLPPDAAAAVAREAVERGFRQLKIKVGGPSTDEDEARVQAIAAAAPGTPLRLDGNQGFGPDAALAFIRRIVDSGIRVELLEQPVDCADWDGLAAVTRQSPVPVIADEAVLTPADALRVAATGAAHGINIKLAKSGIAGALDIIGIARAARLRLMLGCMLESDWGIRTSVHLACGTGAFDYLDLDSHVLIGQPPPYTGFSQRGETIHVEPDGSIYEARGERTKL